MLPTVKYQDLGTISYQRAWDYQTRLHRALIDYKVRQKKAVVGTPSVGDDFFEPPHHYLLLCEHQPVYTLGKSGSLNHLLLNESQLNAHGIEFYKINRGGDITFHGLGQIVGYPILDLEDFFTDVHRYVRSIEEVIIRTIAEFGLEGTRLKEYTGVWLEADETKGLKKRKICAIGVHLSRWVTLHGWAFNVNTDLGYFDNIIPCGIDDVDKSVTSLAAELGREIDVNKVKELIKRHFADVFECVIQ